MEIVQKRSINDLEQINVFKVPTTIIKFALKILYFGSCLVRKLFFKRNQYSDELISYVKNNARSGVRRVQAVLLQVLSFESSRSTYRLLKQFKA